MITRQRELTLSRRHPPRQHDGAGLLADIAGVVAFVAVRLVLPIGLKVGVGLVLAVAPG